MGIVNTSGLVLTGYNYYLRQSCENISVMRCVG